MARNYRRISADSHLEVPNERWTHRIAEEYRDRAPRTITLPDGADGTVIGEMTPRQNPMDLYGGKGRDTWKPFGQTYASTPGTGRALNNGPVNLHPARLARDIVRTPHGRSQPRASRAGIKVTTLCRTASPVPAVPQFSADISSLHTNPSTDGTDCARSD